MFPDYELSDHHGKHRTLSELQHGDPLVLVLSPRRFLSEGSGGSTKGSCNFTGRCRWATAVS